MMGTADSVEYVCIDCRIVGKIALEAVQRLAADVDAKRKVIIGFRAGDLKPDFYEYPDRDTGEKKTGQGLKARLLQVTFAKVDGTRVEIPLVPRTSSTPASQADGDDAGVGTACGDLSCVPAEV